MELQEMTPGDFGEIPLIEVRCGGQTHTLRSVDEPDGSFTVECLNHSGGSVVVTLLGGTKTECHRMIEELKQTSERLRIPLREAAEWYAYRFTWTTMQAWHRYGGPKVAAAWAAAGVTPSNVRILHGLGITEIEDYLVWQQACQYGTKIDLNVVREYVKHGVTSGAEALAWRNAGLQRPAQLAMWKARGVTTPEKLTKRLSKDHATRSLAGASS
jgi:hypothetical protein